MHDRTNVVSWSDHHLQLQAILTSDVDTYGDVVSCGYRLQLSVPKDGLSNGYPDLPQDPERSGQHGPWVALRLIYRQSNCGSLSALL